MKMRPVQFLWLIPLILCGLAVQQLKVFYDLGRTGDEGTPAMAEVVGAEVKSLASQTHGIITLRTPQASGTLREHKMTLPAAFIYELQGQQEIPVRVLPGTAQDVVIVQVLKTQRKMALINMTLALVMGLIAYIGVWKWTGYLRRNGDPADRTVDEEA